MKKSRKVVSVSTSMKDECVSLPKSKSQLAQLHDDDEDVFATSVIDRYAARPLALQNICFATFAVMYDVIQSSTKTGETQDVNTEEDSLYEHHMTSHMTHTSISSEIQKLPKYHIFVDVSIHPSIDCELCHQCFTLPCECAQMEIMMKTGKGELKQ